MQYIPKYDAKRDLSPHMPHQSVDLRGAILTGLVTDLANTQDYGYINPDVDEVGPRVRNVFDAADHLTQLSSLAMSTNEPKE